MRPEPVLSMYFGFSYRDWGTSDKWDSGEKQGVNWPFNEPEPVFDWLNWSLQIDNSKRDASDEIVWICQWVGEYCRHDLLEEIHLNYWRIEKVFQNRNDHRVVEMYNVMFGVQFI